WLGIQRLSRRRARGPYRSALPRAAPRRLAAMELARRTSARHRGPGDVVARGGAARAPGDEGFDRQRALRFGDAVSQLALARRPAGNSRGDAIDNSAPGL